MNSFIICRAKSLAHVPVVVLLFGAAFSSNAQVTGIKGIVEDPDHQPLGGITLRIERQDMRGSYSVRSSSNGSFLYMGLCAGI